MGEVTSRVERYTEYAVRSSSANAKPIRNIHDFSEARECIGVCSRQYSARPNLRSRLPRRLPMFCSRDGVAPRIYRRRMRRRKEKLNRGREASQVSSATAGVGRTCRYIGERERGQQHTAFLALRRERASETVAVQARRLSEMAR